MKLKTRGIALLAVFILSVFNQPASAQSRDLYFQMQTRVIEKAFNKAIRTLNGRDNNLIKMKFDDFTQRIPVKLERTSTLNQVNHYGKEILNLNIYGNNNVKFTLDDPYFHGKVRFLAPRIIGQEGEKTFNIEFNLHIENYYIYFKRIWFGEKGFTKMAKGDHLSCMNQVLDDKYTYGDPEVIAGWKKDIQRFYRRANRRPYRRFKGSIWARVDHMALGYGDYEKTYSDDRNIIKLKVIGKLNLGKHDTTVDIVSINSNLGEEGGARLPLKLHPAGIQIPPIFIKTQAHRIDQDGNYISDENGRWQERCTLVQLDPLKKYAASMARGLARKLPAILDKKISEDVFEKVNKLTKEAKLPALPQELSYTAARKQTEYKVIGGQRVEVAKTANASFEDTMADIIGDFTTYRAGVGFKNISSANGGNALTMGIDSILEIDGSQLVYREKRVQSRSYERPYTFNWLAGHDFAFAVRGKMLNSIANSIKQKFLKTHVPSAVNVYIPNNLIEIDPWGYMVIKPKVVVSLKNYEVLEVETEVRFKLGVDYSGSPGSRRVNIAIKNLDLPSSYEILKSVKRGRHFKTHSNWVFGAVMAIIPFSRYWMPQAARAITEKIIRYAASKTQHYLDNVKRDFTKFDISEYVNEYGALPYKIDLDPSGYMAVYISLDKFYMLEEKIQELAEEHNLRFK